MLKVIYSLLMFTGRAEEAMQWYDYCQTRSNRHELSGARDV